MPKAKKCPECKKPMIKSEIYAHSWACTHCHEHFDTDDEPKYNLIRPGYC